MSESKSDQPQPASSNEDILEDIAAACITHCLDIVLMTKTDYSRLILRQVLRLH